MINHDGKGWKDIPGTVINQKCIAGQLFISRLNQYCVCEHCLLYAWSCVFKCVDHMYVCVHRGSNNFIVHIVYFDKNHYMKAVGGPD